MLIRVPREAKILWVIHSYLNKKKPDLKINFKNKGDVFAHIIFCFVYNAIGAFSKLVDLFVLLHIFVSCTLRWIRRVLLRISSVSNCQKEKLGLFFFSLFGNLMKYPRFTF